MGNLIQEILPSRFAKEYKYDLLNRPIQKTNAQNNIEYIEYDANSNPVKLLDGKRNVTQIAYNALN